MNYKTIFHKLSYLQYPLMLIALYFSIKPYLSGTNFTKENVDFLFRSLNTAMIFVGLGINFSSLQDTSKTQNKLSEKIWKNPKKAKIVIGIISTVILILLFSGLYGYFNSNIEVLNEFSIGNIVLAIGMFGFLKATIEMFENHRADKNK